MRQNLDEKQQKQKDALLYLLNFFKKNSYQFTVITPLSHERILKRKKYNRPNRKPCRIFLDGIYRFLLKIWIKCYSPPFNASRTDSS